jgi:hypothetical protein
LRAGYVSRRRDARDGRKVIVEPILPRIEADIYPRCEFVAAALRSIHNDYTDAELAIILDFTCKTGGVLREQLAILRETSSSL